MPPANQIELTVIVNGQPTSATANVNAPLHSIIGHALQATGNQGQPPENWELRDMHGAQLDGSQKVKDLGLHNGDQIFLNLKAGVGGA